MKSIFLRCCIGPDCCSTVFGCTVSSVQMECKNCTQQECCMYATVTDFSHGICPTCLENIMASKKAVKIICDILKK